MFSKFFIERPIFANVIAIVTMIIGAIALWRLPVAQYPEITPPTVQVSGTYPGANAKVVAETVAAPIEEQVNGVEGMLYMSSTSSNDGSYSLTVTFEVGTNLDNATVLVQNRVNVAQPRLPLEVRQQGLTVRKRSTDILLVVTLTSPDSRYDDLFLSNYATLNLRDELARLPGVGDVRVFGAANYSMRVWLDPNKLKSRNLTTQDVYDAIAEQNVQVAAGQIGQPPTPADQNFQYTITTLGRLSDVEQFENIIIKTARNEAGQVTRVKDVARVELGGQSYDVFAQRNGQPAAAVPIYLLPGANALTVADEVKAKMAELGKSFPQGIEWGIPYDTTKFVNAAIREVYKTLFEAAALVLIVILVFLQDWRAMLVPGTTVPVTIIGAFAAMAALGFSVNLLTLFGLVLAIGIVVDDAIIIVEGAAHHIEEGLTAKQATIQAMTELLGPIIGITLVLSSVFLPTAFLPGITGQLYRQFALVIAATALISAINAVTLKPAQSALWLRPVTKGRNPFYRGFNRLYDASERRYTRLIGWMVRRVTLLLLVFAVLVGLAAWGFTRLPTGFLPTEDQGYAILSVRLPDAASQARTRDVLDKVNGILKDTPGIAGWVAFGGFSLLEGANLPNAATIFVQYTDWGERGAELSQEKIITDLQRRLASVQEAFAFAVIPPAIRGLGQAGGFEMVVQDRGDLGLDRLQQIVYEMVAAGNSQSGLQGLRATFSASTPQLFVDVDRVQAKTLNVPLSNVFNTLQTYLGSAYVNDFNKFGRIYQVRVQADYPFRLNVDDIRRLEVRNAAGEMIPLGTLADVRNTLGAPVITRYNLYPAASIFGQAAPGFSSGEALGLMEQMAAKTLPAEMGYEWTGVSFQEKKVGSQAYFIFGLSVLLVYLVLAAQYESWTNPAAVILAVPLAFLGTALAIALRGMDNNVYTQIGIVLLIALASKNAILIVEFARDKRAQGAELLEAAVEAARLRFRPILMTSFAFLLGMVPLVVATGAGAASRRALGTAVFGGMLASTLLAVLFVPVLWVAWQRLSERRTRAKPTTEPSGAPAAARAREPTPEEAAE